MQLTNRCRYPINVVSWLLSAALASYSERRPNDMSNRRAVMAIPAALVLAATGSLVLAWAAKPRLERVIYGDYVTVCVVYAEPRHKAIRLSAVDQPSAEWSLTTTESFVVSHWDLKHARESWMDTLERRRNDSDSQ